MQVLSIKLDRTGLHGENTLKEGTLNRRHSTITPKNLENFSDEYFPKTEPQIATDGITSQQIIPIMEDGNESSKGSLGNTPNIQSQEDLLITDLDIKDVRSEDNRSNLEKDKEEVPQIIEDTQQKGLLDRQATESQSESDMGQIFQNNEQASGESLELGEQALAEYSTFGKNVYDNLVNSDMNISPNTNKDIKDSLSKSANPSSLTKFNPIEERHSFEEFPGYNEN